MVTKQLAAPRSGAQGKRNGHAAEDSLLDAPLCPRGHTLREMAAAARGKRKFHDTPVEPIDLSPALIEPSPWQPRRDFPEAEIAELAASIVAHGLIEPLVVRRVGDAHYELLAGERRLRAALKAGLTKVRVEVRDATDAEARAIVLVENLHRRDLNAIEEARAYRQLLDAGDYPTQQALAEALKMSQPHVANRLRLLELPDDWQQRIISGEITATMARAILPLRGQPKILAALAKDLKAPASRELSADDFNYLVDDALRTSTRPLAKDDWSNTAGKRVPPLKPTAEQREQLGLIEAPCRYRAGKTELRATNVKLFDELWAAHKKAWEAKQHKRADGKGTDHKDLTPAEKKAKAKEAGEKYQRDLERFRGEWLCYEISLAIAGADQDLLRLLLCAPALTDWGSSDKLVDLCKEGQIQVVRGDYSANIWATLLQPGVSASEIDHLARRWLGQIFWDKEDGPNDQASGMELDALAQYLQIDLERCWLDHQAGPLSERYWQIHDKEQLLELGKELKVKEVEPGMGKEAIVKAFLARVPADDDDANTAAAKSIDLPKELRSKKRQRKGRPQR